MTSRPSVLIIVLFSLYDALGNPAPIEGQRKWNFRGQARDSATVQPIPGAWVELASGGTHYFADTQGRFDIRLSEGTHELVVHALGYRSSSVRLSISSDTTFLVYLPVQPVALDAIRVQIDRLSDRLKAVPWPTQVMTNTDLAASAAATPVEALKARRLRTYPCGNASECIRYRNGLIEPVVCIDELPARGGLAELRTYSNSSIYRIEVHEGGRMVRAYTVSYIDQLRSGRINVKPMLRIDRFVC